MENVILVIHLILALALIATVLLQRSEGGGLGMGGGGGGANSGRPAVSGVAKLTWGLAIGFIITSITLTIIAAQNSSGGSVLDRVVDVPVQEPVVEGTSPLGTDLLPPTADDSSLTPPRADE